MRILFLGQKLLVWMGGWPDGWIFRKYSHLSPELKLGLGLGQKLLFWMGECLDPMYFLVSPYQIYQLCFWQKCCFMARNNLSIWVGGRIFWKKELSRHSTKIRVQVLCIFKVYLSNQTTLPLTSNLLEIRICLFGWVGGWIPWKYMYPSHNLKLRLGTMHFFCVSLSK